MKVFVSIVATIVALCLPALPRPVQAAPVMTPPSSLPTPSATGYAPIRDVKIYYAEWGHGDPVILTEDALGSTVAWGYLVPGLAQHYRVIAFDTRCQGRSTCSPQRLSYRLMASDLNALMQYLHVPHAALIGWSDGAIVGLEMAIRYPARVTRLFAYGANSTPATFQMPKQYSATEMSAGRWAQAQNHDWREILPRLTKLWDTEPHLTAPRLRSIHIKTWIVDGGHDEYVPRRDTDFIASRVPNSGELILPNTGHYALWQEPWLFNTCVLSFLSSP